MLFAKPLWAGIARDEVTVAFRRWKRVNVVAGRVYRTGGGRIEVDSVREVDPAGIDDADAARAGAPSPAALRATLAPDPSVPVYRVEFHRLDEADPRDELAHNATLTDADLADLDTGLERLDRASRHGAWTMQTLRLVAENPERRAGDLADLVGRERLPFKLDVRKLKNLGLTLSFPVGYRISPRGAAYLRRTRR